MPTTSLLSPRDSNGGKSGLVAMVSFPAFWTLLSVVPFSYLKYYNILNNILNSF